MADSHLQAFQKWTPLPANFRENGYMTLGVGKYYHSGGHSAGGAPGDSVHPAGKGTPPLADRYESWTAAGPNGTIQFPDNRPMMAKWGSFPAVFGNFAYLHPDDENCGADYCHPDFAMDGTPPMPPLPGQMPLADFITWNDAVTKMRFAAANRAATGQPFFLVTGIKRPYVTFRLNFHHFDHLELDLRRHIHVRGAAFSCLRFKLADIVLI